MPSLLHTLKKQRGWRLASLLRRRKRPIGRVHYAGTGMMVSVCWFL